MKTIKTHLPEFHFEPELMMSWTIDHDVIHFYMEEAFGIQGLDLQMVIGLTDDGMPSTDPDDIIDSLAVSINGDEGEYQVDEFKTLAFLEDELLPYIKLKFPKAS